MFGFQVDTNQVSVTRKHIEAMLTSNPDVKKALQELISKELAKARGRLAGDIKGQLPGSEHETWRSVRRQVYQKVLGGDLDIMNMKKGKAISKVRQKYRKVEMNPHMRGGNRRKRSYRTIQIDGYRGQDRGFILRFVNSGTKQRFIGNRNDARHYYEMVRSGRGNRGQITPRDFFANLAKKELDIAAEVIGKMIDEEMTKIFNNNNT